MISVYAAVVIRDTMDLFIVQFCFLELEYHPRLYSYRLITPRIYAWGEVIGSVIVVVDIN